MFLQKPLFYLNQAQCLGLKRSDCASCCWPELMLIPMVLDNMIVKGVGLNQRKLAWLIWATPVWQIQFRTLAVTSACKIIVNTLQIFLARRLSVSQSGFIWAIVPKMKCCHVHCTQTMLPSAAQLLPRIWRVTIMILLIQPYPANKGYFREYCNNTAFHADAILSWKILRKVTFTLQWTNWIWISQSWVFNTYKRRLK